MSTPITDRAERCADYGMSVPAETCRHLERVANQLEWLLRRSMAYTHTVGEQNPCPHKQLLNDESVEALAAFEAMKGTT